MGKGNGMTETTGGTPPRSFEELKSKALECGRQNGRARLGVAAAWAALYWMGFGDGVTDEAASQKKMADAFK